MKDEVFAKLKKFVTTEAAVEGGEVTRDTQIEDDLGITGDDAIEFIIAYGKAFNVDVTKFMAANYFEGEGDRLFSAIIRLITGQKNKTKNKLTIKHLERGIIIGKLDEEVINS